MIVAAIQAAAAMVGVPFALLLAICTTESSLNPNAINGTSYGLCQIKLPTASLMGYTGNIDGLFDPNTNALYAAKYLQYQLVRYKGIQELAAAAYNTGTVKWDSNARLVNAWYVQRVFDRMIGQNENMEVSQ